MNRPRRSSSRWRYSAPWITQESREEAKLAVCAGLSELEDILTRKPPNGVAANDVALVFRRHLAAAQRRAANFIAVNKEGEGNWKGGAVLREGEPFAQIRYDGRIFNSPIGGEIDTRGSPIGRREVSMALVGAGGQPIGHSAGLKEAEELRGASEKLGRKP